MDPVIDAGDILYQVRVRTHNNDTVESLYERILEESTPLVPRLIQECLEGAIQRFPQPREGASYFSSIGEEDYRIDWSSPAETIRRRITITPGRCFVDLGEDRIHLQDAEVVQFVGDVLAGTILRIGRRRCIVAASDHGVLLKRGRLGQGPEESFAGCLHALGFKEGDIL
jgi:methionyl-tRNA formyltransferase